MKAEMDAHGTIVLTPESSVESYALKHWCRDAHIQQRDLMRCEESHWRGSKLKVNFDMERQNEENHSR